MVPKIQVRISDYQSEWLRMILCNNTLQRHSLLTTDQKVCGSTPHGCTSPLPEDPLSACFCGLLEGGRIKHAWIFSTWLLYTS